MGNYLLWVFLGITILGLLSFFLLNKYYDLEGWFKKILAGLIGIGIIGTVASFLFSSGMFEKKIEAEKPVVKIEEPVVDLKVKREKDSNVTNARLMEQELEKIISQKIPEKRNLYQDSLNIRKKKRWDTFRYDSLLLTIETAEKLVSSRQKFLKNDIIAYVDGNIDSNAFSETIRKYEADVDSVLVTYRINANLSDTPN